MGRRPGVTKKRDLFLKDQPECEDPASKGNNVSTIVTKELTNVASLENKTLENVKKSPRRSRRIQNAGSSSQDQAIDTVVQNVEASKTEEEDQQCIAQEKKGPEAVLCATSMKAKVDHLFLLLEEQQKTIEVFVSKGADKSLPSQNPCEDNFSRLEMKLSKYKNMYIESQKKIEDLQDENYKLKKKLECAHAKLEGYQKGQHVFSGALDKCKDMLFLSSLTKTTETVLGLSSPPRAIVPTHAPTISPEAKTQAAKRMKADKGRGEQGSILFKF